MILCIILRVGFVVLCVLGGFWMGFGWVLDGF
jgi:hypothetical protein